MKTLLRSLTLGAVLATAPAAQLPWGLDRIDQQMPPLDTLFAPHSTGAGVNIYVVSTGVRATHVEFGGRAMHGYAFDGIPGDCHGQGTAIASVAAGATLGAAPAATIIDVKVLNCFGSGATPNIVAGLDWVRTDFISGGKRPSVVLLGVGGGLNGAIEAAIQLLVDADLPVVMGAGNSAADACDNIGPLLDVIKVGASTISDSVPVWSNQGCCVDLFGPGENIPAADATTGGTSIYSGTEFAAAYAAGAVAVNLGASLPPVMTPEEAEFQLVMDATPSILTGVTVASTNRLLHLGPIAPPIWAPQLDIGNATHPDARMMVWGADSAALTSVTMPHGARLLVEGAPPLGPLYFVFDTALGFCSAPLWVNGTLATPCAALPNGVTLFADECGRIDLSWPHNLLPAGSLLWLHAIVLDGPTPWDLTNALQLMY
jgi:subtilisin family serine protease